MEKRKLSQNREIGVFMINIEENIKKVVMEQERCDILQDNCPNPDIPCNKCAVFIKVFGK